MYNNEGDDMVPKGNEWEVVALTESAYAAAPGPHQEKVEETTDGSFLGPDSPNTTGAMFMSGHFGVATSIITTSDSEKDISKSGEGIPDGKRDSKDESLYIEGLISDVAETKSFHGNVEPSTLAEKEQSIYDEAAAAYSDVLNESIEIPELLESRSPRQAVDQPRSNVQKHVEDDNLDDADDDDDDDDDASESWWRRRAFAFYELVRNADPFWSVVVAATLMGVVIIGQRWHQDKPQLLQLKSHLVFNEKGGSSSSWVFCPAARGERGSWGGSFENAHIRFASFAGL